jgi:hypothetical protein
LSVSGQIARVSENVDLDASFLNERTSGDHPQLRIIHPCAGSMANLGTAHSEVQSKFSMQPMRFPGELHGILGASQNKK